MRLLGMGSVLGALALALAGCGDGGGGDGGGGDRSKIDRAEADVQAVVDGVLHDVAGRAGLAFKAGNRFFVICGESFAPGGIHINSHLLFDGPAELPTEDAIEQAVQVLDAEGWRVKRPPQPEIFTATKGVVVLRLDFRGPVQVDADTECIETGGHVARETSKRPNAELEWK